MQIIANIWNFVRPLLDYWGYLSSLLVLVATLYAGWLCVRGIAPVLIRLGHGLARRKIAIFAKQDASESLRALLEDSKLFRTANLVCIRTDGDFGKAEQASIFLVHSPDWSAQNMQQIISRKRDAAALVVYAPPGNPIPQDILIQIGNVRNATVVNLRGRLMNDIILSMITTSYAKKRD